MRVSQTVQYQIVPGQVILYDQFTDGQVLPTLLGESLTVRSASFKTHSGRQCRALATC